MQVTDVLPICFSLKCPFILRLTNLITKGNKVIELTFVLKSFNDFEYSKANLGWKIAEVIF
jgi:hypothetical protein